MDKREITEQLRAYVALKGSQKKAANSLVGVSSATINKTTIIIAARPMSGAEQASLWCFPWDTAIQRARPGKDPFARVFEYLHTALYQQGILVTPPRLVDGEELPEDHPLSPANITQMRGSFLDPVTKFLPSKERS